MEIYASTASDEAFLLDLLNTTPVVDGVPVDALADFDAATSWMADRGVAISEAELSALMRTRSALQAVLRGERSSSVLTPLVEGIRLEPIASEGGLRWQLCVDGENTGAARAVLAWDGLRLTSPGRLRPCANTECQLFLIDRSKPNTARLVLDGDLRQSDEGSPPLSPGSLLRGVPDRS